LGTNYGVGHPTAIALPPDANGYQRIQLWYYDSQGDWNSRVLMRAESGDGFHFETPIKTNLQSPNKIKYVDVAMGGHHGLYLATASPFYLNVFNYSWDGINWFWGDAGKGVDFYTNYLANNFNIGSVTGCVVGSGAMVGDQFGRIGSMAGIKFLSTEGGFGKGDNHKPGDQCYNASEDVNRGDSMDMYALIGNLTWLKPTAIPTFIPTSVPTTIPTQIQLKNTIVPSVLPTKKLVVVSGDATGDGKIDLADFGIWKNEYLGKSTTLLADFDRSGKVDLIDFGIWKGKYLK